MITKTCTYKCDLCGSKQNTRLESPPKNWVALDIEHPDTERLIAEKHICDECCLGIIKRHPG